MILSIDMMGHEGKLSDAVEACRILKKKYEDVSFILVGDENKIKPLIKEGEFQIHHAPEAVVMGENPLISLRNSKTSMYQAILLVKEGKADGVISAASTASYVVLTTSLLKTIDGIKKPGFMSFVPTSIKGKNFALLDCGANLNCDGRDLYLFAKMADIFKRKIEKIEKPSIGVINIGTEEHKGFPYHNEAYKLIKEDTSLNSVGFIETKEILNGIVDCAICDGYTGNLTLKTMEGSMKTVGKVLKKGYKKPWNWLGALFSLNVIKSITKTFDYKDYAGAVVIGLNKIAVKTHGSADTQQFVSAINLLYNCVKNNVVEGIKQSLITK